jgi:hypothetical protein
MGLNSTNTAWGFGQMGSVYTDLDQVIIPPKDHVIVAIQFLAANTPTVMVPEKLDQNGPNFPAISGSTADHVDAAGNNYFNFNGAWASEISDATHAVSTDITLETPAVPTNRIKVGDYVLLVNGDASEADTDMVIDTADTPYPIYNGPNKQGVYVTDYDGVDKVKLSAAITSSSDQALVFLDPYHGAGGTSVASQEFPAGTTIYGRWAAFKPSAAGVICYFGK